MRMSLRLSCAMILAATLCGACSGDASAPSREENSELDTAAEMLNRAPETLSNIGDGAAQNSNSAPEPGTDR